MTSRVDLPMLPAMKRVLMSLLLGALLSLGALGMLPGIQAAAGEVYCVTPNTGSTFIGCDAIFATIQAAVDAATDGEEIRVAGGLYTDVHQVAGLTQSVYLTKSLTLRGGYSPDFTAWDPSSFETTLDAQGQGRVFHLSGGISTTIEGFTITGGDASGLGAGALASVDAGGGLFIDGVTVTLSYNRIQANLANNGLATDNDGYGGGLYGTHSVIRMTENTVFQNRAVISPTGPNKRGSGGGLYFDQSKVEFIDNTVLSNTASISGSGPCNAYGGGMAIYGSDALLDGNLIEGNVAAEFADEGIGGGVYLQNNEVVTITNNQVRQNVANKSGRTGYSRVGYGGGIANRNQSYQALQKVMNGFEGDQSRPTLAGFIHAQQTGSGAAEARRDGSQESVETTLVLLDNLIENNLAGMDAAGIGGGVYLISADGPLNVRLERNRVLSNTSKLQAADIGPGGGLAVANSKLTMDSDILQNNEARSLIGFGGGLYLYESEAWLTNTVFLANRASEGGAALMVEAGSNVQIRHATFNQHDSASTISIVQSTFPPRPDLPSTLSMTNVIIAASPVGVQVVNDNTVAIDHVLWHHAFITVSSTIPPPPITITNQINGYPYFAADGYHLTGSPYSDAIGQGIWAGVAQDIDGQPRRSPPDIGSDEYWEVAPTPRSYLPLIFK